MTTWKRKTGQYQNGISGYLGKYKVFSVDYDRSTSKNDPKKYELSTLLPGIIIKSDASHFKEEDQAKSIAGEILEMWLDGAGLK